MSALPLIHISRYEQIWPLRGGGEDNIRPIHPDDAQMLQDLVQNLSPESWYYRFVSSMTELPPSMLSRLTLIDYDREMALVATMTDDEGKETQIGVARYVGNPDGESVEFALAVGDNCQKAGVGRKLLTALIDCARQKGYRAVVGDVLSTCLLYTSRCV